MKTISCWQDSYGFWAREKEILTFDYNGQHFLKAVEENGEIAERLLENPLNKNLLAGEIGDLIACLLIMVEQEGRADMRMILMNEVGITHAPLACSFDQYQHSVKMERQHLEKLNNIELGLMIQVNMSKLCKSIIHNDTPLFYKGVSGVMEVLMMLLDKQDLSADAVVCQNFEKIRNRTGKTVNGIFIKDK